jgi:hypothetical protein
MTLWHWLVHVTGCDYGLPYGRFGFYNFWSGVAGSFLVNMIAVFALFYYHRTCQDHPLCLRWGKYPAAGGLFKVCHRHHPDLQGTRPHRELIHRLHREHLDRQAR